MNKYAARVLGKRGYTRSETCKHLARVQFHNEINYHYYCDDSVLTAFLSMKSKGGKLLKHKVTQNGKKKDCFVIGVEENVADDYWAYAELPPYSQQNT